MNIPLAGKKIPPIIIYAICSLLMAYILFPAYFDVFIPPPSENLTETWKTLDPSWMLALNYAGIKSLVFGKEFILTYGPLSFLSTRVMWGINPWLLVLYDLFIAFNFFMITFKNLNRESSCKKSTVFLAAIVCFMLPVFFNGANSLVLLAFLVFWARENIDRPNIFNEFMQCILLLLILFIKVNTWFPAVAIFLAAGIYNLIYREKKIKNGLILLLPVFLILVSPLFLNINLKDYFSGAYEIISGYNSIMYLEQGFTNELVFCIIAIGLGAAALLCQLIALKNPVSKTVLVFGIYLSLSFIFFKQAFVRADIQHISEFYSFMIVGVFCIRDFHQKPARKYLSEMLAVMVFILIFFSKKRTDDLLNFQEKFNKSTYFKRFGTIAHLSRNTDLILLKPDLPERILKKVGKQTVDIYPWNIQLLIENDLNYTPRPVCQSYSSYTQKLELLNFNFYNSEKAPEFVIYQYDAIDNRYPLFDEPLVNITILNNYRLADSFREGNRLVLLMQNTHRHKIKLTKTRDYEAETEQALVPDSNSFYTIELQNKVAGGIVSFFYHAPPVSLNINTVDGQVREYRTSASLLSSGLFCNMWINSTRDFLDLIKPGAENHMQRIKSYSVKFNPAYYKRRCKITEYKIER
jgi:hypothetical protein